MHVRPGSIAALSWLCLALVADSAARAQTIHRSVEEIALRNGVNILGRAGDGVIVLDSPTISRNHARISVSGEHATVEDLASKN